MVCCEYQRLPRGLLLDQLKHAEQWNVIAAAIRATRRPVVVYGVTHGVGCHGRLVRNRGPAIPGARVCDADEQRKHPQPQNARGQETAMAT